MEVCIMATWLGNSDGAQTGKSDVALLQPTDHVAYR